MIDPIIFLLLLLQIKHWYFDFINQTPEEIASKGIYGDSLGINHSAKHAIGTMLCVVLVTGIEYITLAGVIAFFDFVLHYHIDWIKMRFGNTDIKTKSYWIHLGADQMAHQLTYLFIIWMVFA